MCNSRPGTGRGQNKWIDSLRVYVKGGHGGNGTPAYGGIGGAGGSVIIETCASQTGSKKKKEQGVPNTLYSVFAKEFQSNTKNQRLEGGAGFSSSKHRLIGAKGTDKILQVPRGVSIVDECGNQVADLDTKGQRYEAALGGRGGSKDTGFLGLPGQKRHLRLELKLLADVGLVGFPNAGKSTLLKAMSNARPKIANYPFTTIKPNLGHIEFSDLRKITVADLPGLIEGAHYNVGMGHRFLKHVERTSMLLFVVDVCGFQLSPTAVHRNAVETVALLNRELELYNSQLLDKPAILLVNKMDLDGSDSKFQEIKETLNDDEMLADIPEEMWPQKRLEFLDILPISAQCDKQSVDSVKQKLRTHLDLVHDKQTEIELKVTVAAKDIENELVHTGGKDPHFMC